MANKRLLALLLVFVMLFSFAACKDKTGDNDATSTPNGTSKPTQQVDLLSKTTPVPNRVKPVTSDKVVGGNEDELVFKSILPESKSNFDDLTDVKDSGWSFYHSGKVVLSEDGGVDGTQCIKYYGASEEGIKYQYSCPTTNLYKIMTKPGTYKVSFQILIGGDDADSVTAPGFAILIRGNGAQDENSFIAPDKNKVNYRYNPNATIDGEEGDWLTVEFQMTILDSDIEAGVNHSWYLCLHQINEYADEFYVDNFQVLYAEPAPEKEKLVTTAETWVANEMTFIANKTVDDPVNTRLLDVEFTNGHKTITMPGFWDGDNVWRVRFALPEEGTWTYKTIYSDSSDSGVHNKTGSINVTKYAGDLEIYKHGFVKTEPNTKYFMYADGTPFFYLGDTHWNFLAEEYDKVGAKGKGTDTTSHFKYIVNKRVAQGYTVYQSQPNEVSFDMTDGITVKDIIGLKNADKYFKYIADQGLVHANAQFFFASSMNKVVMKNYSQAEYEKLLDTLSRYWVARFGAYPVMYTLAQEVDNDFYYKENTGDNTEMTAASNPWKFVCTALYKYDPYKNPISAHQEGASKIINYTTASNSAFRNVEGHTWWANQWKPVLNQKFDFSGAKDYWNLSGQGKPAVVYEACYDGLWANEYVARAQGWLAFLNGMFGHGYGAIDIWLYNSTYNMDADTIRNGVTITVETKQTPWGKSIEYASGYQMGYMKQLFEKYEWWKLVPAFDDKKIFVSETGTYSVAHIDTDLYIAYLYDDVSKEGTKLTGTFTGLDANAEYTYQWFNPRTTAMSEPAKAAKDGANFAVGERPSAEDWVLVVQKAK